MFYDHIDRFLLITFTIQQCRSIVMWNSNLILKIHICTGRIPKEIGRLINLEELQLEVNHFDGPLPEEIGNMTLMSYLWLNDNNFTGSISCLFLYYWIEKLTNLILCYMLPFLECC